MNSTLTPTKLLTFLLSMIFAGSIAASNVRFMQDSALAAMTPDDIEVLRKAARNTLDYAEDGDTRRWENSATGAKGVLTPLSSFEQDGAFCRKIEMFAEVKAVSGRTIFVFCRQADGTWRAPSGSAKK
jgi:surface antigen